jgi:hypothetical protein
MTVSGVSAAWIWILCECPTRPTPTLMEAFGDEGVRALV